MDVELAWGVWDHPDARWLALCDELERPIIRRLLAAFARFEIPATWAIVARLAEAETIRDRPGTAASWYAPDIIEWIRNAKPAHEIGSHGYAHIYFDRVDVDVARRDLELAVAVHDRLGLTARSFVFPRNLVARQELLADYGFRVFRGVDAGMLGAARRYGRYAQRVTSFATQILPVTPPVILPKAATANIVELPSSMLLMGRNGPRAMIAASTTTAKCIRGIDAAADRGRVFHLWFHPSNFYFRSDVHFGILDAVLAHAAHLRDRGHIDFRTMGSFAQDS